MSMVTEFANRNKEMALRAAKLQAGKIALAVMKQLMKAKMPMYMRGYLANPFASFVMANMVHVAVMHDMHKGNEMVEQLSDAMLEASMMELLDAVNVQELIGNFLTAMPQAELVALNQAKLDANG